MDNTLIKNELEEKGYVVIPNVISSEEIKTYTDEFHKWRTSVDNLDKLHNKINPHHIYKYHQVGHQRHAWLIRTNPKVYNIFKKLWNTDDLVVSFDGSCYMPKNTKSSDNCWTHTDQGFKKEGLHCYQGFVALTDNEERTLVVYEGSHKLHEGYFKEMNITVNKDWNIIDQTHLQRFSAGGCLP